MKRLCECWHGEDMHAAEGFRPCKVKGCDCRTYIEEDVIMETRRAGYFDEAIAGVLLGVVALIILVRCITEQPVPVAVPDVPAKPGVIDSGNVLCPNSTCYCWPDGTIKECPDPRPPKPPGVAKEGG